MPRKRDLLPGHRALLLLYVYEFYHFKKVRALGNRGVGPGLLAPLASLAVNKIVLMLGIGVSECLALVVIDSSDDLKKGYQWRTCRNTTRRQARARAGGRSRFVYNWGLGTSKNVYECSNVSRCFASVERGFYKDFPKF